MVSLSKIPAANLADMIDEWPGAAVEARASDKT